MKKPKCKHCGKESSRGYKEYYNPTAGLWGVTTCAECGNIDYIKNIPPGFSNLSSRHRWYLHLLRVACVVVFFICVGIAFNYSLDGRLRLTFGIMAFLLPGLYVVLKGNPNERTTATNKAELEELIRKERKLDESPNILP